ncbi:SRPBCC domain-containing protein [Lentzea sp. JNUCC 0626]|uniref:SRPBCC family protein n=1 Tax=Lentzea sp. JNUCC 0626 TaxID=3367513 RepID=UPI003747FE24
MSEQVAAEGLELRVERLLPASPEDVFDAYTDPEKQKIWFSILDEKPRLVEITTDLRVGGHQVAVWGPDEQSLIREVQTFLEIDRPHRLVTESVGSGPDGMTVTTRIVVTFEARGDATLMSVVQTGFPVPEVRDFFVGEVWVGAFDRIEAFLGIGDGRS